MWHVRAEAQRHVRTVDIPAARANALVELALLELAANGTAFDAGQAALVRDMCTSGARLQLAIARCCVHLSRLSRVAGRALSVAPTSVEGSSTARGTD